MERVGNACLDPRQRAHEAGTEAANNGAHHLGDQRVGLAHQDLHVGGQRDRAGMCVR